MFRRCLECMPLATLSAASPSDGDQGVRGVPQGIRRPESLPLSYCPSHAVCVHFPCHQMLTKACVAYHKARIVATRVGAYEALGC